MDKRIATPAANDNPQLWGAKRFLLAVWARVRPHRFGEFTAVSKRKPRVHGSDGGGAASAAET